MIDRPKGGERAILVQLALPGMDAEGALHEFYELAISASAEVVGTITSTRTKPDAKFFIGLGKAGEIQEMVQTQQADLVLVNHDLSPSQERNLERLLSCRVVGRSGLILDIFAQRARTFEGKLQVELAQLQHVSTRLIRGWTHLERQAGGIGLRGPGETQLETDRRLLRERIKLINKRLEKVSSNRQQNRRARQKAWMPTVSLVGYTNAGKSSLFQALTGDDIFIADQLFATLDPLMRKIELPGASAIILADTVGFIRDLPHGLIKAFHATLEETKEAHLLLHVIDVSDAAWPEHVKAVEQVLTQLQVDTTRMIQVFNKIDVDHTISPHVSYEQGTQVWVSAKTKQGLNLLYEEMARQLFGGIIEETIILLPQEAKLRAQLYQLGAVLSEDIDDEGGWHLTLRWSARDKMRLMLGSV